MTTRPGERYAGGRHTRLDVNTVWERVKQEGDLLDNAIRENVPSVSTSEPNSIYEDMISATKEQVDIALGTDQLNELPQALPPVNPTIKQCLMLLYMSLRNKKETTNTLLSIYNDAGTRIAKGDLSDNGITFTKDKLTSGV